MHIKFLYTNSLHWLLCPLKDFQKWRGWPFRIHFSSSPRDCGRILSNFLLNAAEVQAPGMPLLELPLKRPAQQDNSALVNVNIYGWEGRGVDEGSKAASWWSSYLGRPVRFVRFNPGQHALYAPNSITNFLAPKFWFIPSLVRVSDINW